MVAITHAVLEQAVRFDAELAALTREALMRRLRAIAAQAPAGESLRDYRTGDEQSLAPVRLPRGAEVHLLSKRGQDGELVVVAMLDAPSASWLRDRCARPRLVPRLRRVAAESGELARYSVRDWGEARTLTVNEDGTVRLLGRDGAVL